MVKVSHCVLFTVLSPCERVILLCYDYCAELRERVSRQRAVHTTNLLVSASYIVCTVGVKTFERLFRPLHLPPV